MTPIIQLEKGRAFARIAPALGARVTSCALEDHVGEPLEILHRFPEERHDLVHWAKSGMYPLIP